MRIGFAFGFAGRAENLFEIATHGLHKKTRRIAVTENQQGRHG